VSWNAVLTEPLRRLSLRIDRVFSCLVFVHKYAKSIEEVSSFIEIVIYSIRKYYKRGPRFTKYLQINRKTVVTLSYS